MISEITITECIVIRRSLVQKVTYSSKYNTCDFNGWNKKIILKKKSKAVQGKTGAYIRVNSGLQGMTEAYRGDRGIHKDVQWLTGDDIGVHGWQGLQIAHRGCFQGSKGNDMVYRGSVLGLTGGGVQGTSVKTREKTGDFHTERRF